MLATQPVRLSGRIVEQGDGALRYSAIARDYARLSPADRARTLVLDPTREGRQRLTDAIRAELVRDGTLGADAIVATTLEPLGLTRAEASYAASWCCQTNCNSSPIGETMARSNWVQAARNCHSAKAAEGLSL